jgi:hypothetical protein
MLQSVLIQATQVTDCRPWSRYRQVTDPRLSKSEQKQIEPNFPSVSSYSDLSPSWTFPGPCSAPISWLFASPQVAKVERYVMLPNFCRSGAFVWPPQVSQQQR